MSDSKVFKIDIKKNEENNLEEKHNNKFISHFLHEVNDAIMNSPRRRMSPKKDLEKIDPELLIKNLDKNIHKNIPYNAPENIPQTITKNMNKKYF